MRTAGAASAAGGTAAGDVLTLMADISDAAPLIAYFLLGIALGLLAIFGWWRPR